MTGVRGAAALALAALLLAACSSAPPVAASARPSASAAPEPSASAAPRPQRTEVAIPAVVHETAPLGKVDLPPAPSPTATPDAAVWRVHGIVLDEAGKPLAETCVSIGPRGCIEFSPRTDERGVFYFEVPQLATIEYDLYFFKDGFRVTHYKLRPTGPAVFGIALPRAP